MDKELLNRAIGQWKSRQWISELQLPPMLLWLLAVIRPLWAPFFSDTDGNSTSKCWEISEVMSEKLQTQRRHSTNEELGGIKKWQDTTNSSCHNGYKAFRNQDNCHHEITAQKSMHEERKKEFASLTRDRMERSYMRGRKVQLNTTSIAI